MDTDTELEGLIDGHYVGESLVEQYGLSIRKLSTFLDVSPNTISSWIKKPGNSLRAKYASRCRELVIMLDILESRLALQGGTTSKESVGMAAVGLGPKGLEKLCQEVGRTSIPIKRRIFSELERVSCPWCQATLEINGKYLSDPDIQYDCPECEERFEIGINKNPIKIMKIRKKQDEVAEILARPLAVSEVKETPNIVEMAGPAKIEEEIDEKISADDASLNNSKKVHYERRYITTFEALKMLDEVGIVEKYDDPLALVVVAHKGRSTVQMTYLNKGANPNIQNEYGISPLIAASAGGHIACVQGLLEFNADVDVRMKDGYTALMCASRNGKVAVVQRLLNKGANPDAQNTDCQTPLMLAARDGLCTIVEKLLSNGAHANMRDDDGNTAIMYAARYGHLSVLQFIVKLGEADISMKNGDGQSAIEIASNNGHAKLVAFLRATDL